MIVLVVDGFLANEIEVVDGCNDDDRRCANLFRYTSRNCVLGNDGQ